MPYKKYNGKKAQAQEYDKNFVPLYVINCLKKKLLRPATFLKLYEDGTIKKIPFATLGNKIYAWVREGRIQNSLKSLFSSDASTLWLTFTTKYAYTEKGRRDSWKFIQKEKAKLIRRLKNLGMVKYIDVKEAHFFGGCHLHVCGLWNQILPFVERKKYDKKIKKWVSDFRLEKNSQLWTSIKKSWPFFVDVKVVKDEKIGSYLAKELGKGSHIETALKNFERGKATKSDVKKIWAIYYASVLKIRSVSTSRNIPSAEVQEGETEPEFIKYMNNTTEKKLVYSVLIPKEIKNNPLYTPYTGAVERESKEYVFLMDWIKSLYPK